jgi:hypothetical protein
LENNQPVVRSHQWIGSPFGVRHQPHDISLTIQNPGDVPKGAVRIVNVAKDHAVLGFQFIQRALVGVIASFPMSNRKPQDLALHCLRREWRIRCDNGQPHRAADELEAAIPHQSAREESGLHKDLETIANPQHQPTLGGKLAHCLHHW